MLHRTDLMKPIDRLKYDIERARRDFRYFAEMYVKNNYDNNGNLYKSPAIYFSDKIGYDIMDGIMSGIKAQYRRRRRLSLIIQHFGDEHEYN